MDAVGPEDLKALLAAFVGDARDEDLSKRSGPWGRTLMHHAVEQANLEVVQFLASHARGTVSAPDIHKTTPLHLAPDVSVVRALLQLGANTAATDLEGQTPLHLAAARGNTEVIGLLVSHGAPVNSATLSGWTPLHGAASYGRALAAQQLLEMGAELHCRDKEGNTPLHLACLSRQLPAIEVLLAAGADMSVPNGQGQTPASLCTSLGAKQLFEEEQARRQQQLREAQEKEEQRSAAQGGQFEADAKKNAALKRLSSFNWKPSRFSVGSGFPLEDDDEADGSRAATPVAVRRGSIGDMASGRSSPSSMRSRNSSRRASLWDEQLPDSFCDDDGDDARDSPEAPPRGGTATSAALRRSSGLVLGGGAGNTFLEHALVLPSGSKPAGGVHVASLSMPQAAIAPWSWLRALAGSPLSPAPASRQRDGQGEEGLDGVAPRAKSFTFGASSPPAVLRLAPGGAAPRALSRIMTSRGDVLSAPQLDVGGPPPQLPAAPRVPRALRKCSTLACLVAAGGSAPQLAASAPLPVLTPLETVIPMAQRGSSSPYSSSRRSSGSVPQTPSAADEPPTLDTLLDAEEEEEEEVGPAERKRAMYLSLSMKLASTEGPVREPSPVPRTLVVRSTSRCMSMVNVPFATPAAGRAAAAVAALLGNARMAAVAGTGSAASGPPGGAPLPAPPPPATFSSSFRRRSVEYAPDQKVAGSPNAVSSAAGLGAGVPQARGTDGNGSGASPPPRRAAAPRKNVSFVVQPHILGSATSSRPVAPVTAHVAVAPPAAEPPSAATVGPRSKSAGAAADATWAVLSLTEGPAGWSAGDLVAAAGGPLGGASPTKTRTAGGGSPAPRWQ